MFDQHRVPPLPCGSRHFEGTELWNRHRSRSLAADSSSKFAYNQGHKIQGKQHTNVYNLLNSTRWGWITKIYQTEVRWFGDGYPYHYLQGRRFEAAFVQPTVWIYIYIMLWSMVFRGINLFIGYWFSTHRGKLGKCAMKIFNDLRPMLHHCFSNGPTLPWHAIFIHILWGEPMTPVECHFPVQNGIKLSTCQVL